MRGEARIPYGVGVIPRESDPRERRGLKTGGEVAKLG